MIIPSKTKIKEINDLSFTPVLTGFTKEEVEVEIEFRDLPKRIVNRYHSFIRHHTHKPIFISQLTLVNTRHAIVPANYAFTLIGFELDNSDFQAICHVRFITSTHVKDKFEKYVAKIDRLRSMYYTEENKSVSLESDFEFPARTAPCQFTQLWEISKTFKQFLWFTQNPNLHLTQCSDMGRYIHVKFVSA